MKKVTVSWKDFESKAPLPHYVCAEQDILVEYNETKIIGKGCCLFPGEDETLKQRGHVNHFHLVMLVDVIHALNVVWNLGRVAKDIMCWDNMLSIQTSSKVREKLSIDKKYDFQICAEKTRKDIWKIVLIISDAGKCIAEVTTMAFVK